MSEVPNDAVPVINADEWHNMSFWDRASFNGQVEWDGISVRGQLKDYADSSTAALSFLGPTPLRTGRLLDKVDVSDIPQPDDRGIAVKSQQPSIRREALATKPRISSRVADAGTKVAVVGAKSAGAVATTVGSYAAYDYLAENAPEAWAQLQEYFSRSGTSVESAASAGGGMTEMFLKKALDFGIQPSMLESAMVSMPELKDLAKKVISKWHSNAAMVDSRQAPVSSTGDVALDVAIRNQEVTEACQLLNLNAEQYAKVLRFVNTHTSKDIETCLKHRAIAGLGSL